MRKNNRQKRSSETLVRMTKMEDVICFGVDTDTKTLIIRENIDVGHIAIIGGLGSGSKVTLAALVEANGWHSPKDRWFIASDSNSVLMRAIKTLGPSDSSIERIVDEFNLICDKRGLQETISNRLHLVLELTGVAGDIFLQDASSLAKLRKAMSFQGVKTTVIVIGRATGQLADLSPHFKTVLFHRQSRRDVKSFRGYWPFTISVGGTKTSCRMISSNDILTACRRAAMNLDAIRGK